MKYERLGIYGGSFDPVHAGHIGIARMALRFAGLDRVIFVPAFQAPHRRDQPRASAHHREKMLALAVAGEPRFEFSDVETRKGRVAYTVDTLAEMRAVPGPGAEWFFIMGSDSLRELPTWKDYGRILTQCSLIVFARKDAALDSITGELPAMLTERLVRHASDGRLDGKSGDPGRIHFIESEILDVSSSGLREALRKGEDIGGQVPEDVYDYIRTHGLYRG